ncbi:hypothetical protein HYC85_027769 [Camellia sinensis]|uniref:Glabrous enhancer-binding protein-like DBD domain-containing protein n=1 Tax=Camellia sinensis TaxID=4442 RepID=A0A7J7FVA6_CAMSI|nr:hypothetical protein HYC85_027769 [Camellia sinensis]
MELLNQNNTYTSIGIIDYIATKGVDPSTDMNAFFLFIKDPIHVHDTKTQLSDKVRKLMNKYKTNATKAKLPSNPYDQQLFDFFQKIRDFQTNAAKLYTTNNKKDVSVDTPFLTDLKTQTSPVEHSVILHVVLVQRPQSRGCEPRLRSSGPSSVPCLGTSVLSPGMSLKGGRLAIPGAIIHISGLFHASGNPDSLPKATCPSSPKLPRLGNLGTIREGHFVSTPARPRAGKGHSNMPRNACMRARKPRKCMRNADDVEM